MLSGRIYRLAKVVRDLEVYATLNPKKIVRRYVNKRLHGMYTRSLLFKSARGLK